jgi:hypothetical protein
MDLKDFDVVVINLETRSDRLEEVRKEMKRIGFENFIRFPGFKGGDRGSVLSHLHCINGRGNRFIFEDDVYFEPEIITTLSAAIKELPDDFDMLYLGANVKTPQERYSEHLFTIKGGTHTNHAILFSDHARQLIPTLYDPDKNPITHIFDHWLFMEGQKIMKCFCVYPMVAFQRGGYSDVRFQWFDYREEMLTNQMNNMK